MLRNGGQRASDGCFFSSIFHSRLINLRALRHGVAPRIPPQKQKSMSELRHYMDAFTSLHTAKRKGYKAPHKAVLLLSVIDLVEEGTIDTPHIELSDRLERKFHRIWTKYLGNSSVFTADVTKPFYHMQHEPFWKLVSHEEASFPMAAEPHPFVESTKTSHPLPKGGYSIRAMRKAFAYAEMDNLLFELLQNADARAMLRVALINEYLCNQPTLSMPDLSHLIMALPLIAFVA